MSIYLNLVLSDPVDATLQGGEEPPILKSFFNYLYALILDTSQKIEVFNSNSPSPLD